MVLFAYKNLLHTVDQSASIITKVIEDRPPILASPRDRLSDANAISVPNVGVMSAV